MVSLFFLWILFLSLLHLRRTWSLLLLLFMLNQNVTEKVYKRWGMGAASLDKTCAVMKMSEWKQVQAYTWQSKKKQKTKLSYMIWTMTLCRFEELLKSALKLPVQHLKGPAEPLWNGDCVLINAACFRNSDESTSGHPVDVLDAVSELRCKYKQCLYEDILAYCWRIKVLSLKFQRASNASVISWCNVRARGCGNIWDEVFHVSGRYQGTCQKLDSFNYAATIAQLAAN